MKNYEMKAEITITGYESMEAESAEEAARWLQERIERDFEFKAPLLLKSVDITVKVVTK